jgi:hypothetical protein
MSSEERRGYTSSADDPPNRGRGRTRDEATNNAVKRLIDSGNAKHGDVLQATTWVVIANAHVGEYIVELG